MENIKAISMSLKSISIYRNLLNDVVFIKLKKLLDYCYDEKFAVDCFLDIYSDFYFELVKSSQGCSLCDYIIHSVLHDENYFTLSCSKIINAERYNALKTSVCFDLDNLYTISCLKSSDMKQHVKDSYCNSEYEARYINRLPEWTASDGISQCECILKEYFYSSQPWGNSFDALEKFHKENGAGIFINYKAFKWERLKDKGILKGIEHPDAIALNDLIGYEGQKKVVINNTLQFLQGYPSNNMLLYGDRGTGKSSTVKALLNEYHSLGLRIIEVAKNDLLDFPEIIQALRNRTQKFIIFVDDLAFEDKEENYTALKAILEGGMESKPQNVLIYATSNRRHLIKESFSDRQGNSTDEVHISDTMHEKLSLADRFGVTVTYSSPDKNGYLEIVEGLARKRNLDISNEELISAAMKWELLYNGRSPRTAAQFIDYITGERGNRARI